MGGTKSWDTRGRKQLICARLARLLSSPQAERLLGIGPKKHIIGSVLTLLKEPKCAADGWSRLVQQFLREAEGRC